MERPRCIYEEDVETDYDIQTGHSWYTVKCTYEGKNGEKCYYALYNRYCKDKKLSDDNITN